jgi:hypothetical protein
VAALIPPNPPLSKGGTGLLQLKNWVFNSKTHWILLIRWVFGCGLENLGLLGFG